MNELRWAFRQVFSRPLLSAILVAILGLGIGGTAAVFSLAHQIFVRPLPVPEPDELVNLGAPGPKPGALTCGLAGGCEVVFSHPMFRDLEAAQRSFAGLAAHRTFGAHLAFDDDTFAGHGLLVSGSYFPTLGLRPAVGRLLAPDDDRDPDAHPLAVLSHRFWQTRFGGDRDIVGRTVVVNGHPLRVVGVAPEGFEGTTLGHRPAVFVPLSMRAQVQPGVDPSLDDRRAYWLHVFARLRPDVSMAEARDALNATYRGIIQEVEAPLQEGMTEETRAAFLAKRITFEPGARGQTTLDDDARLPIILLFVVTAVVLLITCANIANLLLARGARRRRELAIRNALGAGRARLVRQLLAESSVLAALGGAASVLLAVWSLSAIQVLVPPDIAGALEWRLEPAAIAFAGVLAAFAALAFGTYPALRATRPRVVSGLGTSQGTADGPQAGGRVQRSLVTAQVAMSVALLVTAGLFVRSLLNVGSVELGFDTESVATFAVYPSLVGHDPTATAQVLEATQQALRAMPGVSAVSASTVGILRHDRRGTPVSVEGFEAAEDADVSADFNRIGDNYFRTLGVPLLAGREFVETDDSDAPRVAVVNEAFTRRFGLLPADAVGTRMAIGAGRSEMDIEIVGVVRDAAYADVKEAVPPTFFVPWRQSEPGGLVFYLRTEIDPARVLAEVPALVRRIDPNVPVLDAATLERLAQENVFLDRMIALLTGGFAVLATTLSVLGLYGLLAYLVARRTREIGIRMALGAGPGRIRRMVFGEVGAIVGLGALLGVAAAFVLGRVAEALLYGVEGTDPGAVLAGLILLAAAAGAASIAPIRRASHVDPATILREET